MDIPCSSPKRFIKLQGYLRNALSGITNMMCPDKHMGIGSEENVGVPRIINSPASLIVDFTWLDDYGAVCPQLYVGFDRPITTENLSTGADSYLWTTSWGETSIEENPVLTCPRCPPLPWPGSEFWVQLTATKGVISIDKKIDIVPIEV